jgi:CRP-like cAMP-binding protein/quercetin dioxygenase-like cupin family protein
MLKKSKKIPEFKSPESDSYLSHLIESINDGKKKLRVGKGTTVFSQGANADAIYFIQSGKVKITLRPGRGEEIALATLEPDDFFGEGCLVGQSLRPLTATAISPSLLVRIEKEAMLRAFQIQPELSKTFIASLIARTIDIEENICNHLFSDAEKRLAHVLLKLHRSNRTEFSPNAKLSPLSDEALANLVGITRGQLTQSLGKFKRLGLIYNNGHGEIGVRAEMMADMVLAGKTPAPTSRARKVASLAPLETVRKNERRWVETSSPGIWICNLFDDTTEKHGAIFVKMTAGAIYPDHQHMGREQFYVIEGDVRVGNEVLNAGDYHRAEKSTFHKQVTTKHGCTCIILGYVGSISAKQLTTS